MNELKELCVRKLSGPKQDMRRSNAIWDKRAAEFMKMIQEEKETTKDIVDFMKERADIKGCSVIDIGCGAGRYLVAMLLEGMKPEGIEPSTEMIRYAKEYIRSEGFDADSVEIYNCAFSDFAIHKQYDYVFISNSPVLSYSDNYYKILNLAKKGIIINSWLNIKDDLLERTAFALNEKANTHGGFALIYFMNILFADGFYPEFKAITRHREERLLPDDFCRRYTSWIYGTDYEERELEAVCRVLDSFREEDGKVTVSTVETAGMLYLEK